MDIILDLELCSILKCETQAILVSQMTERLKSGSHFYPENRFDGVYYCNETANTWLSIMPWASTLKIQNSLDRLMKNEWLISFKTPACTYYRPDHDKLTKAKQEIVWP